MFASVFVVSCSHSFVQHAFCDSWNIPVADRNEQFRSSAKYVQTI